MNALSGCFLTDAMGCEALLPLVSVVLSNLPAPYFPANGSLILLPNGKRQEYEGQENEEQNHGSINAVPADD